MPYLAANMKVVEKTADPQLDRNWKFYSVTRIHGCRQEQFPCQVPHPSLNTHWRLKGNAPTTLSIRKGPCKAPCACTSVILTQRLHHNLPMERTHRQRWGTDASPWEAVWLAFNCASHADDQERLAHHWHKLGWLLFLMWSPLQKITSSPSLTQLRPSPAAKEKHQRQYLLSPCSLFFSLPCRQTQHEVPEELVWEDASPAGSQMPTASPAHVWHFCISLG